MCRLTQMEGGRRPLADAGHSLKVELERVAELGLGRCRADMLGPRLRPRCQPGGDRRIRGDPARAYHYWNHGAKKHRCAAGGVFRAINGVFLFR